MKKNKTPVTVIHKSNDGHKVVVVRSLDEYDCIVTSVEVTQRGKPVDTHAMSEGNSCILSEIGKAHDWNRADFLMGSLNPQCLLKWRHVSGGDKHKPVERSLGGNFYAYRY